MLTARFRNDYDGEFVVVESKWSGGRKTQSREWIPNPIINQHISGRAACIASDHDLTATNQNGFDYRRLERHRGGLLGSKKLQTYGTGPIAMDMRLEFAVDSRKNVLEQLIERNLVENRVVYTTPKMCLAYPGRFYLVPYNPGLSVEALPLYLACFDGHKEVFMLGYNRDVSSTNSAWADHVKMVMQAYPGVKFFLVGVASNMFDQWRAQPNSQTMTYREFISYCDVSR